MSGNYNKLIAKFILGLALIEPISGNKVKLFDFTTASSVDNWSEISDIVRTVGKSKATLVLQKTQQFQRAVFFTLLNSQPNGAGFAGIRTLVNLDLSDYKNIELVCRAQGSNNHYKVVLRHKGLHNDNDITYEQIFTTPISNHDFDHVKLPLDQFKAYYRGREIKDAKPLDTSKITMFGIQVFGGVYLPYKQSGVSSLEIDMIYAAQ